MAVDPYSILGVSRTASQDEIKNAYRNLAKKHHPDLNPGNKEAEKKFKEINAANELIGTAEQRAKFDRGETEGMAGAEAGAGARPGRGPFYYETQRDGGRYSGAFEGVDEDFFESLFGGLGGRFKRGRSRAAGFGEEESRFPGEDHAYRIEISFRDAVLGVERELMLPGGKKLRVKIPPGVESGTQLRFRGEGGAGARGGPPGDAYVQLEVRPSKIFKRSGKNLEIEVPISLDEAVLGGEVKVPTMEGPVLLKVPAGVSSGTKLRIRGKGVAAARGGAQARERGDQIVVLKVVLPQQIDPELQSVMRRWRESHPYHPRIEMEREAERE